MNMAKASEADMEMAMSLCTALESLERGLMPPDARAPDEEDAEDFDSEDAEHCYRALNDVLRIVRRGSIGRVVWGMAVLLDPANKVVNPDSHTLEEHPDVEDAKKDAARLDWLLHHLSGKEMRRVGIETSGGGPLWGRVAIDAAMLDAAALVLPNVAIKRLP